MDKKIIFLDIDGTIATHGEKVSQKVIDAIQQARHNGHYVFLCTGRNKVGTAFLNHLDFDGLISSAGGYIEVQGQMIDETYLTHDDVVEVQEAMEECQVLYNMEGTCYTYADEEIMRLYIEGMFDIDEMNSEMQRLLHEQKEQMSVKSMAEYESNPMPIHKISFIARSLESLQKLKDKLSSKYMFVIHDLFSTDTINGEMIQHGMDKGKAILKVVAYLGMKQEDTIGFGDSMNDYEMLKVCHHSVAMENAVDELKAIATTVCESVEHDGVYYELERLHIIDGIKV